MTEATRVDHRKHFTASEQVAQQALEELCKSGFLATTVHSDISVLDIGKDERFFIFFHRLSRTLVRVTKKDSYWVPTTATVQIGDDHWILDRSIHPLLHWRPRAIDPNPIFSGMSHPSSKNKFFHTSSGG